MAPPLTSTERSRRWRARHPGVDARWRRNDCRVFVGEIYVGNAPTPESARHLNEQGREFRDRQKQSRA